MAGPSDRTRRWLSTLGNPAALTQSLSSATVELSAPTGDPAAEIALAMAATLLLRLDEAAPALVIDVPQTRSIALPRLHDPDLADALALEHAGLASIARLTRGRAASPTVRLIFGADGPGLTIDSDGWVVAVGNLLPGRGNPVAAAYAGVLACTEVIKNLLHRAGVQHRRIRPWRGTVSLWDHTLGSADPGPAIGGPVDLDDVAFIGCGGICAATAWTLALLPLAGTPLAIDDDTLDDTNLNRQIIAGWAQVGELKAELVAAALRPAGAQPRPIPRRWDTVELELRRACDIGVISVDHDPTRREVQLDLPRLLLNAGNADTGLYRVTRHDFLSGACLACISHGNERSTSPEQSAAQRLGLPLAELQIHLDANTPIPEDLLAYASITDAERNRLRGVRARVALGIVCGDFAPAPDQPALSMPALSAAPGVLLAAELVKERLGGAPSLSPNRNHLAASILAGPHERWSTWRGKRAGCACSEHEYQHFYRGRWSEPRDLSRTR
jgi:hypothetical protein